MKAHIPEQVIIVKQPLREVSVTWDSFPTEEGETVSKVVRPPMTVSPVFPVCPGSSALETARKWAKGRFHTWDAESQSYKPMYSYDPSTEVTVPNTWTNLQVIDYDVRGNGGRAWKCVHLDTGWLFDLREDVLLEAMTSGTVVNGVLKDQTFAWAQVGSQMKLVRVGSEYHAACVAASTRGKRQPIKDLVPGGVYKTKAGDRILYMGKGLVGGVECHENFSGIAHYDGLVCNAQELWLEKTDPNRFLCFTRAVKDDGTLHREWYHHDLQWTKTKPSGLVEDTGLRFNIREVVNLNNAACLDYAREGRAHPMYGGLYTVRAMRNLLWLTDNPKTSLMETPGLKELWKEKVETSRGFNKDKSWNPWED